MAHANANNPCMHIRYSVSIDDRVLGGIGLSRHGVLSMLSLHGWIGEGRWLDHMGVHVRGGGPDG
jgi:hypothetical protein